VADQFREVEAAFAALRDKFSRGRISQREFIDSLKQLRIKDDEGRFWMIGAQSGNWYFFNGDDWVKAKPPSFSERKAICIYCGFENELEAETCARCGSQKTPGGEAACPECGAKLDDPAAPCPECRPEAARASSPGTALSGWAAGQPPGLELVIRSFHPATCFWFFGIFGVFAGMLFGLLVGVTNLLPGLAASLPAFFVEIQGKLLGGIVFTVLGGVFGFAIGGPAGFIAAAVSNGVLSLVGGIGVRAVKTIGPRQGKGRP
jgi:hypothetical protein